MLEVGRLVLTLPSCFAGRAAGIASQLGSELGLYRWERPADLTLLRLPPLRVSAQAPDREVARQLAAAIAAAIGRGGAS